MRFLGALLVIFGVVLLLIGGLTLIIPSDVINLGSFSIVIHDNVVIPMPPILGLACTLLGIVLIAIAPVRMQPY
jgi:hypothetical protein